MKDPHVVALNYKADALPGIRYENPPPLQVRTVEFEGELRDGLFRARMLLHYPTESEARVPVDAYLRSWEICAGVNRGRAVIRFSFDRSEIIDRAPPEPGVIRGHGQINLGHLSISATATAVLISGSYPDPPSGFAATTVVETLWRRYERFVSGNEPLFAMAYFCLTVLENDAGGRVKAASKYSIEPDVLRKIGELSSLRGGVEDARKANASVQLASGAETAWLQAAIRSVIRQAGATAATGHPSTLTMNDLPKL